MILLVYSVLSVIGAVSAVIAADTTPLWGILLFFGFFIGFLILHILVLLIGSFFINPEKLPEKNAFHRFMTLATIDVMLTGMRIHVKVNGAEKLPDRPFVYVSNHLSVFDPMIAMLYLRKHRLAFVSKKENIQIIAAGKFMLASGCTSLDRENNRAAAKAIITAVENVTSGRNSMGIYPEGKSNRHPEKTKMLPFHHGSFRIATKAKAPVVIAVISNTRKALKQLFTHVDLDIVRVLEYDDYKDLSTGELSDLVYNIMLENIRF
ncbi:MAG: 1-acyl-sn-glycerol-3-phosphate acyltransferase [Oscillospiraceae bacterium]|nr:1-acyl-sn-glycerol-3-phosphate acyltransferase [Oscillospiraceae bacterium]